MTTCPTEADDCETVDGALAVTSTVVAADEICNVAESSMGCIPT
jgi:hypothetical protein